MRVEAVDDEGQRTIRLCSFLAAPRLVGQDAVLTDAIVTRVLQSAVAGGAGAATGDTGVTANTFGHTRYGHPVRAKKVRYRARVMLDLVEVDA